MGWSQEVIWNEYWYPGLSRHHGRTESLYWVPGFSPLTINVGELGFESSTMSIGAPSPIWTLIQSRYTGICFAVSGVWGFTTKVQSSLANIATVSDIWASAKVPKAIRTAMHDINIMFENVRTAETFGTRIKSGSIRQGNGNISPSFLQNVPGEVSVSASSLSVP